jgi:hypothetical protein
MKVTALFFTIVFASAFIGGIDGATIRAASSDEESEVSLFENENKQNPVHSQRKLLFGFGSSISLDQILELFTPVLAAVIQSGLRANLDGTSLDAEFRQDLSNVDVAPGCSTPASLTYDLGTLLGLETFQIESMELVPGPPSTMLSCSFS